MKNMYETPQTEVVICKLENIILYGGTGTGNDWVEDEE